MLPILILYIDKEYSITYWIIGGEMKIVSPLTLSQAIQLLKNVQFDLIVSDPLHIAILRTEDPGSRKSENSPIWLAAESLSQPPLP
ncbi:MAG: hypothetical protein AB1585_22055 [Thermodesulfobacteriota bacterium]